MEKLTYTKQEASRLIGISEQALNALVKSGQLATIQIGGRTRISRIAIEKLLERGVKLPSVYKKMSEEEKQKLKNYKRRGNKQPEAQ